MLNAGQELNLVRVIRRGLRGGLPPQDILSALAQNPLPGLTNFAPRFAAAAEAVRNGEQLVRVLETSLGVRLRSRAWLTIGQYTGDLIPAIERAEASLDERIWLRRSLASHSWQVFEACALAALAAVVLYNIQFRFQEFRSLTWPNAPALWQLLFYIMSPWAALGLSLALAAGLTAYLAAASDRGFPGWGRTPLWRKLRAWFLRSPDTYQDLADIYASIAFSLDRGMTLPEAVEISAENALTADLAAIFRQMASDMRDGESPRALLITPFAGTGLRGLLGADRGLLSRSLNTLCQYYRLRGRILFQRRSVIWSSAVTLLMGLLLGWLAVVVYSYIYLLPSYGFGF